jgi:DNA repair exonuclease SbcCD ATPase subunit
MFNFLKKLFKLEPEQEDVTIEQIKQWFQDKTEPIYSKLNEQLKDNFNRIPEQISVIKENITNLENAEIKDEKKIDPKVKQVVLGNRKNYIRLVNQFISNINIPSEINPKTSLLFCSETTRKLDELSKNSQKTYYTAQHLFADQVEKIAKSIKELDNTTKAIKTIIEKNKIADIEKSKAKIKDLIESIEKKNKLIKDLEEAKEHLNKSQKLKQESETKIIEFKKSKEFDNYNRFKQEKEDINNQLHNLKNQIIDLFSSLMPALKKYQRVALEDDKLVGEYAENSVKSLLEDKELKIIKLLQNLKKSILSDSIDLRDKKREKALEKIENITENKLKDILANHENLNQKENEIDEKISQNKVMPLLKEYEYKLEHHTQMIEKNKNNMAKIEKDIENINIDSIKQEIQDKIKESMNIELDIKVPSL